MCLARCGLHLHHVQEALAGLHPPDFCRATNCYEKLGERRYYVPEIIFSTQITVGSRFLQLGIIVDTTTTIEINDLKNR